MSNSMEIYSLVLRNSLENSSEMMHNECVKLFNILTQNFANITNEHVTRFFNTNATNLKTIFKKETKFKNTSSNKDLEKSFKKIELFEGNIEEIGKKHRPHTCFCKNAEENKSKIQNLSYEEI